MRRATPKSRIRWRALAAVAAGALGAEFSGVAHADIRLLSPAPWILEADNGDPQKAAPCGVEPNACFAPSANVTPYFAGEPITVEWLETVAYDGYYRIAVSYDENHADLTDPPRNAFGDGGALADAGPPVAPILVDDVFPHMADSTSLPNDDTYNLLPLPNRPCERCTLQVIQVVTGALSTSAPAQYVYHQCADIVILPSPDGGTDASGYGTRSITDAAPDQVCESDAAGTLGADAAAVVDAQVEKDARTTTPTDAGETFDDAGGVFVGGSDAGDAGSGATSSPGSKGDCGCAVAGARGSPLIVLGGAIALATMLLRRQRRSFPSSERED
jgi:hypothetical protein